MASLSNNFEGVDYQSKTLLESMSHGDFMMMTEDDAWKFVKDMTEKTMQWEGFTERFSIITPKLRGDVHSIENSRAAEAKMTALMRRIEALKLKRTLAQLDHINQIFTPSCYNCHSPTHELEDCPLLPNPLADGQD